MLKLFFVSFLLIISFSAKAELLIEPLVGASLGGKIDVKEGDSYSSVNGSSYGGRLGFEKLGFQLGLDYLASTLRPDSSDDGFNKDFKTSEWAGFIGFKLPILLRFYAGYIFSAKGDTYDYGEDSKTATFRDGSGTKFGMSFTSIPFINLNFEYRSGKFDKLKVGSENEDGGATYSAYMVSLSIPLTF